MKHEFWTGGIFGFFKLLLGSAIYLAILTFGMVLIYNSFGEEYAGIFIWFFLLTSSLLYLYKKNKKSFSKENLRNLILKIKFLGKSSLVFLGCLALFIIGIVFLFLIGGWIAGLSATSIIIILLLLILLK